MVALIAVLDRAVTWSSASVQPQQAGRSASGLVLLALHYSPNSSAFASKLRNLIDDLFNLIIVILTM